VSGGVVDGSAPAGAGARMNPNAVAPPPMFIISCCWGSETWRRAILRIPGEACLSSARWGTVGVQPPAPAITPSARRTASAAPRTRSMAPPVVLRDDFREGRHRRERVYVRLHV